MNYLKNSRPSCPVPVSIRFISTAPSLFCLRSALGVLLRGVAGVTLASMIVKGTVREGRLVVDEPTDLPEGTEIDLLPLDPGDWLDEADRAALHDALRQSDADVAAGRLIDSDEILKELRSR